MSIEDLDAALARTVEVADWGSSRHFRQIGYDSEAAFNRAFKREFGMPPATWRRSYTVLNA